MMDGHSARAHALLSASGSHRWMNCTPSARLEDGMNVTDDGSIFSKEGTLAHEIAESMLQHFKKKDTLKGWKIPKNLKDSEFFYEEMPEEVRAYVDAVIEEFQAARLKTKDAVLLIEEKIDLTDYIEEGFGSNDAIIIADGVMFVCDLKFGKGVKVSADDNPQLKLYALGALQKFEMLYGIEKVVLVISQPRIFNFSQWAISAEELTTWGETVVREKAKLAWDGQGEQLVGGWCRFCKAAPVCRALADENLKLAQYEFADPNKLTNAELAEVYEKADQLQSWVNSISAYMLAKALEGENFPGYKLVEGRSVRQWLDEDQVAERLRGLKLDEDKIYIKKLAGITAVEKEVGKKVFAAELTDLCIKSTPKPTLVPESDKREAIVFDKNQEIKSDFE